MKTTIKKTLIMVSLISLAFASCKKDDCPEPEPEPVKNCMGCAPKRPIVTDKVKG